MIGEGSVQGPRAEAVREIHVGRVPLILWRRMGRVEREHVPAVDVLDPVGLFFRDCVGVARSHGQTAPEIPREVQLDPSRLRRVWKHQDPVLVRFGERIRGVSPVAIDRSEQGSVLQVPLDAQEGAGTEGLFQSARQLFRTLGLEEATLVVEDRHFVDALHLAVTAPPHAEASAPAEIEGCPGAGAPVTVARIGSPIMASAQLEGQGAFHPPLAR